jgi:hypothetical protein
VLGVFREHEREAAVERQVGQASEIDEEGQCRSKSKCAWQTEGHWTNGFEPTRRRFSKPPPLRPIVLTSVNVRHARALHATVPRPLYQDFMCNVRVLIRQVRIATQAHHQIAKTPMIALDAESG